MALRKSLILRRRRSGRLEGRTTLVQPDLDFFTRSFAGMTREELFRGCLLRGQLGIAMAGETATPHHVCGEDLLLPRPLCSRQFVIDLDAVAVRIAEVNAQ